MKFQRTEMKRARIEIIPMIDTIFFLLVFFMITSLSMVRMKALPVALPRGAASAAAAAGPDQMHPVVLTVTDTSRYFVNRVQTSPDALSQMLQARITADPKAVIVLNFSKAQTTQNLIRVMDMVNKVHTPSGDSVKALLATEPIDKDGRALPAGGKS